MLELKRAYGFGFVYIHQRVVLSEGGVIRGVIRGWVRKRAYGFGFVYRIGMASLLTIFLQLMTKRLHCRGIAIVGAGSSFVVGGSSGGSGGGGIGIGGIVVVGLGSASPGRVAAEGHQSSLRATLTRLGQEQERRVH